MFARAAKRSEGSPESQRARAGSLHASARHEGGGGGEVDDGKALIRHDRDGLKRDPERGEDGESADEVQPTQCSGIAAESLGKTAARAEADEGNRNREESEVARENDGEKAGESEFEEEDGTYGGGDCGVGSGPAANVHITGV